LIGIAITLDSLGHSTVAAKIIAALAPESSLAKEPKSGFRLALCMARAQRVTEALELSEKLFAENAGIAAEAFTLPALIHNESLSPGEHLYYRTVLQRRIDAAMQRDDKRAIATAHYNLGNYLRGRDERLALRHYRQAAEYDPNYLSRGYYLRELAGILFQNGRYRFAARFYKQALDLGEGQECKALYADALHYSGKYREAQEAFESYIAANQDADSEWKLKAVVIEVIRQTTGLNEQTRDSASANNLVPKTQSPDDKDLPILLQAISRDALCAPAWFSIGLIKAKHQDVEDAVGSFLVAAIVSGNRWMYVTVLPLLMEVPKYALLLADLVAVAYRLFGEGFRELVIQVVEEGNKRGAELSGLLEEVSKAIDRIPARRRPREIRFLGKNDVLDRINLND